MQSAALFFCAGEVLEETLLTMNPFLEPRFPALLLTSLFPVRELTRGAQTPGPVVDLGQLIEDSFSKDRKLREADSIDIFGRHHFRNENEV